MTLRRLFLALAGAALVAVPALSQQIEAVAARVNDEPITTYDVRQRMALIIASTGVQPTAEILPAVQQQALTQLINERLQLQEAAEYEITVTREELDDALDNLAAQNEASRAEVIADLAQAGVDVKTLEDQIRAELAWNYLVSGLYRSRLRVSDDQIEDTLSRIAAGLSKPQYLLSEIVIDPPAGVSAEQVRQVVEGIYAQLQSGASFSALARQYSASTSAAVGGDIGWVRAGEVTSELEAALATLSPGQVTPPIETTDGLFIVALRDVRAPTESMRVTIKQALFEPAAGAGPDAMAEVERRAERARERINGCGSVERAVERSGGATVTEIGDLAPSDLAPIFRNAVEGLEDDQTSAPLRTPAGVMLVTMCGRTLAEGAGLPSREAVENRLLDEQLSRQARTLLRNLRQDALIEPIAR